VIRFADDFVVVHEDLDVIRRCKEVIEDWLKGMSLELKPQKTSISHTLEDTAGKVGLTSWALPSANSAWASTTRHTTAGGSPGSRPSSYPADKRQHTTAANEMIRKRRTAEQKELIARRDPGCSGGWTNYFRIAVSKRPSPSWTSAVLEPAHWPSEDIPTSTHGIAARYGD